MFAGAAGEVLIAGEQKFDTLQFLTDGYVLNADPGNGSLAIEAATGTGTLNVEQGISVTVNAPIVDGTGNALLIVNGGTVILNGTNTYTGGTTVYNSAIQISADANLGAATGGLTLEGHCPMGRILRSGFSQKHQSRRPRRQHRYPWI